MTTRRFLCDIEKHFLPRVNAREVRIECGKDAKLCIIFSSAYFHSALLPLSYLSFSFSRLHSFPRNAFRLNPTPQPWKAFGDTQANSNFPQSDFFQSTPLEGLLPRLGSRLPWIDLSLSFFHFSSPVTYPFSPVPSSFVWRVIKLATSDGEFNWFHSVCVECQRTRRAAISTDISQNDISCSEFSRGINWLVPIQEKLFFK